MFYKIVESKNNNSRYTKDGKRYLLIEGEKVLPGKESEFVELPNREMAISYFGLQILK